MKIKCILADHKRGLREAFKTQIRLKLGHCPNLLGSLPSPPKLGRIWYYYIRLFLCELITFFYIFYSKHLMLFSCPKFDGNRQIPKINFCFKPSMMEFQEDLFSDTNNQPQTDFKNSTRGMHVQETFTFDF